MVSSCCICSKETNPFEPHRSYHRIPANEEIRNKWFGIIGRIVSYKGARVCSDHFTENDYHEKNPYIRIRRLKNAAVPSVNLQKKESTKTKSFPLQKTAINSHFDVMFQNNSEIMSQNERDIALCNSKNHDEDNAGNDINEIRESENVVNDLILTQDVTGNLIDIFLDSEKEINATCIDNQEKVDVNFENNINDISEERKFPLPNLGNPKMRNVFLKRSKYSTVCFMKADFSSDEKWTAFLKCIAYKKREYRIMRQRNKHLQKRIVIFQNILRDLLRKI